MEKFLIRKHTAGFIKQFNEDVLKQQKPLFLSKRMLIDNHLLIGSIDGNKIWMQNIRLFIPGISRYFSGSINETDKGVIVNGKFKFQKPAKILFFIMIALNLISLISFKTSPTYFPPPVKGVEIVIFILGVLISICLFCMLSKIDEQAIRKYFEELDKESKNPILTKQ